MGLLNDIVTKEMIGSYVILRRTDGHNVFCFLKGFSEGILITVTNRTMKVPLREIESIERVDESDVAEVKKSFGLMR